MTLSGFQRARGLENNLVHVGHGVHRIVGRLVMMFWVVAQRRGPDVIQFMPVKSPVADEPFGELLVIRLHPGHGGAQRR